MSFENVYRNEILRIRNLIELIDKTDTTVLSTREHLFLELKHSITHGIRKFSSRTGRLDKPNEHSSVDPEIMRMMNELDSQPKDGCDWLTKFRHFRDIYLARISFEVNSTGEAALSSMSMRDHSQKST